jgi:predicted hotdog family 3-hydroxylacyl-ACP dehydratase
MSDFPPIAQLVPHGESMLELERLVDWGPGRAECAMRVSPTSRFVVEGALETVLLLEPMGQAVAACLGYEAYRSGEGVRIGMIVGCREFRAHVPRVAVGTALRIKVERHSGNAETSRFECEVDFEGRPIATATLTLVHGPTPAGSRDGVSPGLPRPGEGGPAS